MVVLYIVRLGTGPIVSVASIVSVWSSSTVGDALRDIRENVSNMVREIEKVRIPVASTVEVWVSVDR